MPNISISPIVGIYARLLDEINPQKPLILGQNSLTYGDLFDQISKLATFFRELGIGPGDRVAIASVHYHANVPIFLSLLRCGITASFVSATYSHNQMVRVLDHLEPKAIFIDREILESHNLKMVLNSRVPLIEIEFEKKKHNRFFGTRTNFVENIPTSAKDFQFPALMEEMPPIETLPNDIPDNLVSHIVWTSGTTARPKGIEHIHRRALHRIAYRDDPYGFDSNTRLLYPFPHITSFNLNRSFLGIFGLGATLVRPIDSSQDRLIRMLDSIYFHRVTHLVTSPAILSTLLALGEDHREAFQTDEFQFVICSGGPLSPTVWNKFEETFGSMVVYGYGSKEASLMFRSGPQPETRKFGTVGKAIDQEAKIVDANGEELESGNVGEVVVRSKCMMKGYYRMPDETAKYLRNGWFHTGDLGSFDDEGFLTLVGRMKNIIIRDGNNIFPNDVTTTLLKIPGVMNATTLGMPDTVTGERVISCVVPYPDAELGEETLRHDLSQQISAETMPNEIHIMDEFPMADSKIAIDPLKDKLQALYSKNKSVRRGLEHQIIDIAASIFMVSASSLSPISNPDLVKSWDSVANVRFIMKLEQDLGLWLTPQDVMAIHSLRDAVQVVERRIAELVPEGISE